MKICNKLIEMAPYDPTEDKYNIKLDANESFIALPQHIKNKVLEAVDNVMDNRYPDPACKKLREAASMIYNVPADNIAVGNGSDELLSIIISAFNMKSSRIMVALPDFSMYEFYAHTAECEVVAFEKDEKLRINADELIAAAKRENVSLLIFSNPCNPTGQGLMKNEVIKIIESLPECLVVVDEAYMDFWDQSIADCVLDYDNALMLRTCSKAFGLAAMRVGFAVGNDTLIGCINKARSPFNISSLVQAAAEKVLLERDYLDTCIKRICDSAQSLRQSAKALADKADDMEYIDTVTNFALIRTEKAPYYYQKLLEKSICVRLVKNKYLRITCGSDAENKIVIDALKEICEVL